MRAVFHVCALALLAGVAIADAQAPVGPAANVSIESATPDAAAGTLTIAGSHFGTRPFVTLDLVPLNVRLALDQAIIAVVPIEMIPPGTYELRINLTKPSGNRFAMIVEADRHQVGYRDQYQVTHHFQAEPGKLHAADRFATDMSGNNTADQFDGEHKGQGNKGGSIQTKYFVNTYPQCRNDH